MTYHRILTRVIGQVPLMEQEAFTLPEHVYPQTVVSVS